MSSFKDLKVIVEHFDKYTLITQKRADFELFKMLLDLLSRKEDLTPYLLQQIVNIRASLNNGLSDELKIVFPNTIPVPRSEVSFTGIPDPHWLAGFTDGEGSFRISVQKTKTYNQSTIVALLYSIGQHSRDAELLKGLIEYLGCGQHYPRSDCEFGEYHVKKRDDIIDKIIPFFDKYPLQGVKSLDYADFKRGVAIIKAKGHLTKDGLDQIKKIKAGMNKGRFS